MINLYTIYSQVRTISIFEQLCIRFDPIQGFLTKGEGFVLYLFSSMGPGQGEIVEIGSYKGLSTCWIAEGLKDSQRGCVTAIDHFEGSAEHTDQEKADIFDIFTTNILTQKLSEHVISIKSSSEKAVQMWNEKIKKPVRLLFIDGDHSYEGVKKDFELWSGLVIEGGIIGFHDYTSKGYPGVTRFVDELLAHTSSYDDVIQANTLKLIQKKKVTRL